MPYVSLLRTNDSISILRCCHDAVFLNRFKLRNVEKQDFRVWLTCSVQSRCSLNLTPRTLKFLTCSISCPALLITVTRSAREWRCASCLVEKIVIFVFFALRQRLFCSDQRLMLSISFWTDSIALCSSWIFVCRSSVVSSAYSRYVLGPLVFIVVTYKLNKIGPSILPCGTPNCTSSLLDDLSSIWAYCLRSDR